MTSRTALEKGLKLNYYIYENKQDFFRDLVQCIEEVITLALDEHGCWDDLTEYQAVKIINVAQPLFYRLGTWWRQWSVITVPIYKHFCKEYNTGPMAYIDMDYSIQPQFRRRVSFM